MAILNKLVLGLIAVAFAAESAFAQTKSSEPPRKLAPGVITTIRDPNIDDATIDAPRDFSELLSVARPPEWTPNFDPTTDTLLEKAKNVSFQREIWSLEFGFKPLRVINVGGRDIWYLIYFVRNVGEVRSATTTANTSIEIKGQIKPIRFIPSFVLQAHDLRRAFRDTTLPDVVSLIAAKERVSGQLYDSVSISRLRIPVSTPTADRRVWGVATWDNVDPRADYISVFVYGLTNAYRWEPPKGGYKKGMELHEQDTVQSKALQLNFWRGGDDVALHDSETQFGIPLYPDEPSRQQDVLEAYELDKPIGFRWVYR